LVPCSIETGYQREKKNEIKLPKQREKKSYLLLVLGKLLNEGRVVAEIHLRANDEAGDTGAVVVDFGEPLLLDVLERCGVHNREANKEDIRLGVR